MKLHEIKNVRHRGHTLEISVEPGGGELGEFKVEVEYDYEGPSVTSHGDNHTFDEHHGAEVNLLGITTLEKVDEYDEEGDKVIKTWPKGTDAEKLPGWTDKDTEWVVDKVHEQASNSDDDFNEPDDDDGRDHYYSSRH